jgi:hypothetical protein
VVAWTVKITDSAVARAALCDGSDHHVLCGGDSIVAQYDATTTRLSYDESNNWQVTSADGNVLLTAQGYKGSYALIDDTITDLQLVDLEALNLGLDTPVADVSNCAATFQDAEIAYTALQTPCEEVGNTKQDEPGACATGDDACVVGYEYSTNDGKCKVKLAYVEPEETDAATQAQHKRNYFKSIRKGGVVQRGSETEPEFKKRKFSQMKANTRNYFKQKMQERITANTDNKKKHQMRKEERMPVSIADGSDDFKAAFIGTLRTKFGLGSGQDRDVGIIVGPENDKNDIACKDGMNGKAEYDEILDSQNCITYDAAIDGDTTDVHVLGSDNSYNIGGILVGDKYVPVVKQTLANADAETFKMSCWTGSAWAVQGNTFVAGNEVSCTVSRSGIVVKVDTIVGSEATGLVDGDKCAVGYGCARKSEDPNSADYLVCADTFACEPCAVPEANNDVDATVCEAQLCAAGTGYNGQGVVFDPNLDPDVQDNDNCGICQDSTYNTGANGQCVAYSTDATCSAGYERDINHNSKEADALCVDVQPPSFTSVSTALDNILESDVAGKLVYTATATDNSGGVVTFSLSDTDASAFSIDSTGKVTLDASLSPKDYSFTVTATDAAGNEATKTVSLTVLPDADGDGTHDLTDTCLITGCSVQQLTDAYALLTSANACSGSRRMHTHADESGCKTAGCVETDEIQAIKDAFDNLHNTQCSA